jgi:hypothetical protein
MDLVESLADLEQRPELHEGRLLLLISVFSRGPSHAVEGLTKLAKLDFLLRYPVLLERALVARNRSAASLGITEHERESVESKMVRYRYGPWDHRYRSFLNVLAAKGLVDVHVHGRTTMIGVTQQGESFAERLRAAEAFADIARRAEQLRGALDIRGSALVKFVYSTFPEIASLRMNEAIEP